ncbi:MAG: SDR family oxidoreductase [Ignavibacteriota bacterium]
MKLLVTGASGLLGSNLVWDFSRQGHRVTAVHHSHALQIPGVAAAACDLTDHAGLSRLLVAVRPDCIVHCAAATNLEWCEAHPAECDRINADVPGEIAALARTLDAQMVHISTDAVFDGISGGYRETDPVSPLNRYAQSKARGETAVLREMPAALVLRTNLYGWNLQPKASLAEWILSLLQSGSPILGFSDVVFSPVLANHLGSWILELAASGRSGIFHTASRDHVSKYQFARLLAEVFGCDPALVRESSIADSALTAPRPRNTWLQADRLAAALGRPLPSIREGLEAFRDLAESGFAHRLRAAAA